MIKRTRPPRIAPIRSIDIPQVEVLHLDNGIPLYFSNMGTQEVLRVEAVFRAGRPYETKPLAAMATALKSGKGQKPTPLQKLPKPLTIMDANSAAPFTWIRRIFRWWL